MSGSVTVEACDTCEGTGEPTLPHVSYDESTDACPDCIGDWWLVGEATKPCPRCPNSHGLVMRDIVARDGLYQEPDSCPTCRGDGRVPCVPGDEIELVTTGVDVGPSLGTEAVRVVVGHAVIGPDGKVGNDMSCNICGEPKCIHSARLYASVIGTPDEMRALGFDEDLIEDCLNARDDPDGTLTEDTNE